MVLGSITTLAAALRPQGWMQALAVAALLGSPPMLLAYERANNDLVIVLLLALVAVAGRGAGGLWWQGGLIWLAACLKLYPLAALPVLADGRKLPRALGVAVLAGLGFALVWWIWRDDFRRAVELMPRPKTIYGYGFKVLPVLWGYFSEPGQKLAGGAGLLAGLILVAGTRFWRGGALREMAEGVSSRWFIAGGSTWLLCFVANSNFLYRAALLLLVAVAWFRLWREERTDLANVGRALVGCLLVMVWSWGGRLRLGDAFFSGERSLAICFSFGLEQGLALGITGVVATALALWAWRRSMEFRGAAPAVETGGVAA